MEGVDRLRARALVVPAVVLGDAPGLREPIGSHHPLRIAEAVARLGGRPSDAASVEEHEDAVLAVVGAREATTRAHEDPDPARRVARRILQRLDGMGKWGGYHTDFAHLARGFAGNDRQLASEVGEALLAARLLAEKPSVGQRHVFLNPRRAGEIRRLIETGEEPGGLDLAQKVRYVALHVLSPEAGLQHAAVSRHAHGGRHHPAATAGPGAAHRRHPHPLGRHPRRRVRVVGRPLPRRGGADRRARAAHVPRDPERTNALAHALADDGVNEGDNVAVMARNHRGFVEAVVACSKLGAHALFLNTSFSGPQLTDVAEREKPTAIIYDEEFGEVLADAGRRRKRYIAWSEPEGETKDPTLEELIERGDPAGVIPPEEPGKAIILTSGTTGTPKGASRSQPKSLDPVAALLSAASR